MTDKLPSDERVERLAREIAAAVHDRPEREWTERAARFVLSQESSAVALAKAGMREAAAQLSDYASTDLDLGWDIAGAIRALPDAAADEALARFKADAVREALERFKLLSVAWRAKVEEGTMPTNKEIGYLNCADQIDSLIAELEKEN